MPTEADARIVVDRLLREAGWDIEDKSQVSTEEPAADGRADYLLKNQQTQPLALIETKRFSVDPYSAKEQARPYQLGCLRAADDALIAGRRRMLFEKATGTGKTLTIAMLMRRWFQAVVISRVLFLAGRIELAKQAKESRKPSSSNACSTSSRPLLSEDALGGESCCPDEAEAR